MNKAMQETTLATQADFRPEILLTGAMVSGTHPVSRQGGLLNRVWYLFDGAQHGRINTDRVREIAANLPSLRQIVEQYIDMNTGKPRAECADATNTNVVAMKEETACFGKKCGFASGCFLQCSLGPSHSQDGKPLGVVGKAPAYNTAGQALGNEQYEGVLKVDEKGVPKEPHRHRDNSCLTLSLFLRLVGVPPAPTSALGDALWDALPQALTAVEQGLQAQPLPTPQAAAPAAPPAQAPMAPPKPAAPAMQPPQQMAPPAAPPQQMQTAAHVQQPMQPPSGHALAPIFPGVALSYDQMCELHAIMFVLERSPVKPMSAASIKNMEQRHAEAKKTPQAVIGAWRKTAEGRDLVVGKGINARLKPELWPAHVPQPAGYYATEAQAAATPAPAQPGVVAVQPQAPARPTQKIDTNEAAPIAPAHRGGPVDISTVTLDPESKEALKAHTEAMNNLAAALRGATFQGARQDGGNSGGAHQPVQPAPQVQPPAQAAPQYPTPAGPPAAPPAPPAGSYGFQPPPAPAAPPIGYRDYGAPAAVPRPIVDAGPGIR